MIIVYFIWGKFFNQKFFNSISHDGEFNPNYSFKHFFVNKVHIRKQKAVQGTTTLDEKWMSHLLLLQRKSSFFLRGCLWLDVLKVALPQIQGSMHYLPNLLQNLQNVDRITNFRTLGQIWNYASHASEIASILKCHQCPIQSPKQQDALC